MNKYLDRIGTVLDGAGVAIGISDLNNILNLVLLVVSTISILYRVGYQIYTHFKSKEFNKIQEDLEEATKELEKMKGENKNGE